MVDEVRDLARRILALPARDLVTLNNLLKGEGGEPIGVREPRTPAPESPGDAIAQDYADSAE